jgi:hypothetical protein
MTWRDAVAMMAQVRSLVRRERTAAEEVVKVYTTSRESRLCEPRERARPRRLVITH